MPCPGRLASLEGGIVAEGVGDFGFEFGLVALHEEKVISALFFDPKNRSYPLPIGPRLAQIQGHDARSHALEASPSG